MMKTLGSFQQVINAVNATGIGYKKFFFRANMGYDEIFCQGSVGDFPTNFYRTSGKFIIKFSDGDSFIGSIAFTNEELEKTSCDGFDEDSFKVTFQHIEDLLGLPEEVSIYLNFCTFPVVDYSMSGEAIVEFRPQGYEKLEQWFEESL